MTNLKTIQHTRFCIITPVYNREDCLERCIESVLSQQYGNLEFWIINDGSTDNTPNIISRYAQIYPFIHYYSFESNKGVNAARNHGIKNCSGDFIMFLDSDDMLAENCLKTIDGIILEHPQYNHFLFSIDDGAELRPQNPVEYQYKDWLSGNVTGDFVHVVRKEVLSENLFDEKFRLYEALNWLRIFRTNRICYFYPFIAALIERNRHDSLSKEYLLQNKKHMEQEYDYTIKYLELYEQDLIENNLFHSLGNFLPKIILIGIAIGKTSKNQELLHRLKKVNPLKYIGLNLLNFRFFSPGIYTAIRLWSKYKNPS